MKLLLLLYIVFPTIIVLLFTLDYFYSLRTGKPLLKEWAVNNGYELLNVEYGLIRNLSKDIHFSIISDCIKKRKNKLLTSGIELTGISRRFAQSSEVLGGCWPAAHPGFRDMKQAINA
jgi:hypothetical protein